MVVAIGVEDLVIVSTKDVVVAHKDCDQDVKKVAEQLKQEQRSEWQFIRGIPSLGAV